MTRKIPDWRARLNACRGVLVDSNVLLDVATGDPNWSEWSARALAEVAEHTTLLINPIIYAEVSIGYATISACSLEMKPGIEAIFQESRSWPLRNAAPDVSANAVGSGSIGGHAVSSASTLACGSGGCAGNSTVSAPSF